VRSTIDLPTHEDELEEGEYQIDRMTGRRWEKKTSEYQYRVKWLGHSDEPEAYRPESDISTDRVITE
jgi:hypothetical protein